MSEPTDLELAAYIRRVVLILDPRHYGEEQEKLRLAAKRLEASDAARAQHEALMAAATALTEVYSDEGRNLSALNRRECREAIVALGAAGIRIASQ